ncbi:MAG: 2-C-methyl-D-erythritol 4-phosphate cytidylyltransferase [Acidimicrobiaceae bacterium]|nr:2-C-methyl-D-erythritol 4-phosphate cytidylyltransferase [Acidimicrobiaceae bacterium]
MSTWAIVVAAGRGSRFGGPKQYEPLAGRRVLDWSLDAAAAACDGVVLVVPPERQTDTEPAATAVVAGAPTRSGSVRAGLAVVPPHADVVAVHDAARPLATADLFAAAVAAVRDGADGAICAVPVTDTVKRVVDGQVAETLDRRHLVAVQTPQAFDAATLRAAHASDAEATDDAALVEAAGGRVVVVPGHPHNLKVTNPADLVVAAALLESR